MKFSTITLFVLLLSFTVSGFALNLGDLKPYVAGSFKQTNLDMLGVDDDTFSPHIGVGSAVNDIFSVQIGYGEYGDFDQAGIRFDVTGYDISGVLQAPLRSGFNTYLKAGWVWWKTPVRGCLESGCINEKEKGSDLMVGFGGYFNIKSNFKIGLEWSRVNMEFSDTVDMESTAFGSYLSYTFQ